MHYSPVRHCPQSEDCFSFDLHVLGLPPTFVLSQDQTLWLRSKWLIDLLCLHSYAYPVYVLLKVFNEVALKLHSCHTLNDLNGHLNRSQYKCWTLFKPRKSFFHLFCFQRAIRVSGVWRLPFAIWRGLYLNHSFYEVKRQNLEIWIFLKFAFLVLLQQWLRESFFSSGPCCATRRNLSEWPLGVNTLFALFVKFFRSSYFINELTTHLFWHKGIAPPRTSNITP